MRQILINMKGALVVILVMLSTGAEAITYYSRNSGYWTSTSSWSTVTYGNATNAGTYPQKGDVVFIGDGHRIIMDMNAVCASVTVGQGVSGQLEFSDYLSFTMTIAGTLTINNGAIVNYPGNATRSHNLFISRHIVNNGTLDFYSDNNDLVNVVFNSTVNSVISGTGTFDLNRVTLSKNTSVYTLEVQANAFENALRNLVLTTGTYIHNNTATFNALPGFGALTIGSDAIFRVPQGTVNFVPNGEYLYLEGGLEVTGGTVVVGNTGTQGIRYSKNGTVIPYLNITTGSLEVKGGITCSASNTTSPFNYNMSGGDLLLNTGTSGTSDPVFKVNDQSASTFSMYNGIITLQNPNSNPASNPDFAICGNLGTVDVFSGTVRFGNSATIASARFTFEPFASVIQPNFHVAGDAGNAIRLSPSSNSTSDFSLLSLQIDANKTFDIRSYSGTTNDSRTMTLVYEMDGINALYNDGTFEARTGNVLFQAAEGQWMSGSANTIFYDLTMNNPYGIVINSAMEISNLLVLNNGIIYSSSTFPVVLNTTGSSTIGSTVSFVDGPVKKQVSSTAPQTITFPVGKGSAYRPVILNVQHSTIAQTDYTTEMWNTSARGLPIALPSDLAWVSDIRYYTITPSTTSNLINARVTLSYDVDDVVNNANNLRVARDDGSGNWINTGGIGSAHWTGSITSTTFNTFNNYFTLANPTGGNTWLPVEMVSFTATAQKNANLIQWITASEINSSYFEIEKSENGRDFKTIARIEAAGNSSTERKYEYPDLNVQGMAYYRLKEVDLDGTSTFSKVIQLRRKMLVDVVTYPNPSRDGHFRIRLDENNNSSVIITDASGRIVPCNFNRSGNELVPEHNLKPGLYFLSVSGEDGIQSERLVVAGTE